MNRDKKPKVSHADLAAIVEEIMEDANGIDEVFAAFEAVLEDESELPCAGRVIGEAVSLIAWEYDGNELVGLRARCRRSDGNEYLVSAWEVELGEEAAGALVLAAYRLWLGVKIPRKTKAAIRPKRNVKP